MGWKTECMTVEWNYMNSHCVPNCYLGENWDDKIWNQNLSRVLVLRWRVFAGFEFRIEEPKTVFMKDFMKIRFYENCFRGLQAG